MKKRGCWWNINGWRRCKRKPSAASRTIALDLPEQTIRVGASDSRETLLARLEATTSGLVVLRVTGEAVVPRAIEDFQALKSLARRRNLRLRIVSPVASVVGLAK